MTTGKKRWGELENNAADVGQELPLGWKSEQLKGVVAKLVDGSHNPPPRQEGGLPMLSAQNIHDDQISFANSRNISEEAFSREHRRTSVCAGDVLLTIVGSIGRSAVVGEGYRPFARQRSVAVMTPTAVLPRYLSYQLRSPRAQAYFGQNARGTAQKGIYLNTLSQTPIAVAPAAEQARITSRIDELFSRIHEGEQALERVKKLVERYRQSVLKAAVTGELTREWREKHQGKLESGEALLTRILATRREAWEKAELDKMKARDQKPANNDWKRKYREPSPPDTTDLPELPEGWAWASVEQLSTDVTYGTSAKCSDHPSGIPVIRMGNIDAGDLDVRELKYLPADHDEFPALLLSKGDLLFNRTNSAELVGKSAIFSIATDMWSFASYLIRVRFAIIPSEWIAYYINSVFGRSWIAEVKNQQVGQANVNGSKLKSLAVPVPPLAEIATAIDVVIRELGRANSATTTNIDQLRRAQALRRAVLRTAFNGSLVHQDPTDEPASVLLERIAADGATTNAATTKRTRKAKQPA